MNKESSTEVKPVCFVLMPIADSPGYEPGHFGRVYEHLLKPAIIAAGYTPVRADDAVKTDYIVVGIVQKIVESAMVICDYSSRNPNVMYELGIRHAFDKPVVLIKDHKTDKIFDIQGLRYTEYDGSLRVDSVNRDVVKITKALTETAVAPSSDMNSVVRLAGIKAAEVPEGQTISLDTKILLEAVRSVEKRVREFEMYDENAIRNFYVTPEGAFNTTGEKLEVDEHLYSGAEYLGMLVDINEKNQTLKVSSKKNDDFLLRPYDRKARDLTTLPF